MRETEELVRTFSVRVNADPYWIGTVRGRESYGSTYQIDGSDLLGTAFVYERHPHQTQIEESQDLIFYAGFSGRIHPHGSVFRCTANGQQIPDRRVSFDHRAEFDVEERATAQGDARVLRWFRAKIEPIGQWWGQRGSTHFNLDEVVFLGEHPGAWSCALRHEGRNLRVFDFQVDESGRIVAHPEESGAGAMRMIPGLHLVDVRIPAPPVDDLVDPAAIRRSSQYGRPWRDPAAIREMLSALPAAVGSTAPSRAGGGGRRR